MAQAKTRYDYERHPDAAVFPDLTVDRYEALKASIQFGGQQHPIELQAGTDRLLDGRHRLRACEELAIEPLIARVEVADEGVPLYTATKALERTLTKTQRVLIALRLLPSLKVGSGKATERAASAVGVSRSYVERGKEIQDNAPDLFQGMEAGKLTLSAAYAEFKPPRMTLKLDGQSGETELHVFPPRFTERLMHIAERAHRAGVVDDATPAAGLEALLDHCDECDGFRAYLKERPVADEE